MEKERESQAGANESNAGILNIEPLVLASGSPRRAEILRSVGWVFESLPVEIDETLRDTEEAVSYVERLAREKAEAAAKVVVVKGRLVLGADTTVVVDGEALGKPRDSDDAREMLRRLRGRWHEVLTGVALIRTDEKQRCVVAHESTRVLFAAMSDDEIEWYVASGEPMDKAGAYAIQGRASLFVEKIEGDYWNIVGLPVRLVYKLAKTI